MCVLAVRTPEIRNEAEKFVWKGGAVKKECCPCVLFDSLERVYTVVEDTAKHHEVEIEDDIVGAGASRLDSGRFAVATSS